MTHNRIGNIHDTFDFGGNFGIAGEVHEHVVAFGLVIDGISKLLGALSVNGINRAAGFRNYIGKPLNNGVFDRIFSGIVDNVQYLVTIHIAPPYGLLTFLSESKKSSLLGENCKTASFIIADFFSFCKEIKRLF